MRITVVGLSYVGIANATLLAQRHSVVALDTDVRKVDALNQRRSPIKDEMLAEYLAQTGRSLFATLDRDVAYKSSDVVLICTPTDYSSHTGGFDTTSVEAVLGDVGTLGRSIVVVIKSTVPVGFTDRMAARYPNLKVAVSPEFLREGCSMYDVLYPSRIVVGGDDSVARIVGELLVEGVMGADVPVLICERSEAESIKLFSNTFLAMRAAYFNELDTFAMSRSLDPGVVIEGVCLDPRIGKYYNNPSFGFGGYCLPKDVRQLVSEFGCVPHQLMSAVVTSNEDRKNVIANDILRHDPRCVGVLGLAMKLGADNYRGSSIIDVMATLRRAGIDLIVYEPSLDGIVIPGARMASSIYELEAEADVIIANRVPPEIVGSAKLYTRDLYNRD